MMNLRLARPIVAAVGAAIATACANSSPSSPGSALTGSVTVPRPAQPATNAVVAFGSQPVTLLVQNAGSTQTGGATTYTFEVATDANFSSKVQTKDGVAEGPNGQTTVKLDALAGGRDYFWHARATGGGTTGPFSSTYKFTIGPAIIINLPVPIAPLSGVTTSPRPAFRVTNAARSGPAGALTYFFEISTSPTFTPVIMTGTSAEGANETGFVPNADLPLGTTLYWRATAIDASNGVSSASSAAQSFTTRQLTQADQIAAQLGQALWPGAIPPGVPGHATMGNDPAFGQGWQIHTLFYAPQGVSFQSPDLEMLRYFDLFDRGFDPVSAIAWMNSNGYSSAAVWYPPPEKAVLGLHYVYLAARGKVFSNGIWDIVLRVE